MSKSKVQPLGALVLGGGQVVVFLLLRHGTPLLFLPLVPPHVVALAQRNDQHIPGNEAQEYLVARSVERLVVGAVDVGGDDVGCLHAHVVQG